MSHWLFNVYMDPVMKEVKMGMGRREEGEIEWPLVCRKLGSVRGVGGKPKSKGRMIC